jgi:hypothetical protein
MIFEMMNNFEMHITYCIIIVEVIIRYLLLREACLMISATLDEPKSTTVIACSARNSNVFALLLGAAGNSGILASPSYSYKLTVSLQYKSPPLAKVRSSESINTQSVLAEESGQSKAAHVNWFGRSNRQNKQNNQHWLRKSMVRHASGGLQIRCIFSKYLINTITSVRLSAKFFQRLRL